MFSNDRYGVSAVTFYGIPHKICLDVFSEVEAAFCRPLIVEIDVLLLLLVVVIDEREGEALVVY